MVHRFPTEEKKNRFSWDLTCDWPCDPIKSHTCQMVPHIFLRKKKKKFKELMVLKSQNFGLNQNGPHCF